MKYIKLFEEYTPVETANKKLAPELNELDKTLISAGYSNTGYDENYGRHNYKNNSDEIAIFPGKKLGAGNFKNKLTILYHIPNKKLINHDIEYNSPEEANDDLIKILKK
jgi:hypothetical protein